MPAVEASELVDELRRAGLRITAPRRAICEVMATHHDEHLTAAQLHEMAEELADNRIAPSTVYRTIETLESVGRIHHVHLGHGPAVLHLSEHAAHQHLVCENCGHTEDIPLNELAGLISHLEAAYGFTAGGVHFAMVGRCRSCSRSASRNSP